MTRRRIDPRLARASRLCEDLSELWPATSDHLATLAQTIDGWPTRGETAGIRAQTELTTVETQADHLLKLHLDRADIEAGIHLVIETLNDIANNCHRILRHAAPINTNASRLCTCTSRDGAIIWGDPTCRREAVKSGLCGSCYMREYRWRRDNNLAPREIQPA